MSRDRIIMICCLVSVAGFIAYDLLKEPPPPPKPEIILRTVRAPALLPKMEVAPSVQDPSLTEVKIDANALKRVLMMAYCDGRISDSAAAFLKMTPAEKEAVEATIKKTIATLKPMEIQHRQVVSNENGDSIVVRSFWDKGGKEEFENLRAGIKSVLGEERGGLMMSGVGTSASHIGNFGFYDTVLFVQDGSVTGSSEVEVHVENVDPSRAIRRAALAEPDPDKRVAMMEAYYIKRDEIKNASPIEPVDYIMTPNTPLLTDRYHHLFQGLPTTPE